MTDLNIDRLLTALPEELVPDPEVAGRIHARVAAELRDEATELSVAPDQEVQEVSITADPTAPVRPPARRIDRRVLAAAAAVVVAAVIGAVVVTGDDDSLQGVAEQPTTPEPADLPVPATAPPDPTATYVDGEVSTVDLSFLNPYWVAADDDIVWVASLDGFVLAVDPATATAERGERFEINESSPIAAGHGSLWVADVRTGQVLRYSEEVDEQVAPRDRRPTAVIETGIRVDPSTFRDGRLGMLEGTRREFARIGTIDVGPNVVWVTDLEGRVLRIDPETNEVVQTISVDLEPHLVRSEGRYLALGDQDAEVAAVYDIVTGDEVFRLEETGALLGLDLHREGLLVHDGEAGTVTRYDLATGDASATAELMKLPEPLHVPLFPPALRATDAGVVVPNHADVLVLHPDTLEVVRSVEGNGRAGEISIGPDGSAWITQFYGRTLTRLEPAG